MKLTVHLIQGCTFGFEIVEGSMVFPEDKDWYLVLDLFLVRVIVNI